MSDPSQLEFRKPSRLARFTGVAGEVMLTIGALMALFLAWHLVWNDAIQGARQNESAMNQAQRWKEPTPIESEEVTEPTPVAPKPSDETPPVTTAPAAGETFALLYVPRFGADYVRSIAEGVDLETVLNSRKLGVGRYLESNMLGEPGNFAVAAHRTTWGAPFGNIAELRIGDRIYIEVPEGWYSYKFRNLEYVWATEVDVLNAFPKMNVDASDFRVITLTSCHPKFSEAERVIAYGVYEGWYPRAGGPPTEIAQIVEGAT
jgi:sortase A